MRSFSSLERDLPEIGIEMRFFAVLVAIFVWTQSAIAQTPDCKSVTDSAARLACYDKATPAAGKSATTKPVVPAKGPSSKVDAGKYVDSISAEDALMNAKLKNICRGC
jgi:hypothetical protein